MLLEGADKSGFYNALCTWGHRGIFVNTFDVYPFRARETKEDVLYFFQFQREPQPLLTVTIIWSTLPSC